MSPVCDLDPADYALPAERLARTLSPALVVYLEQVRENVRRMLAHTGGPERWRPHVKTTKLPAVWRELLGAGLRRFKCATTREARLLLKLARDEGEPELDLLVAYPLVEPALGVLASLAEEHSAARVSVLCEDLDRLASIDPRLSVFVDVDPGLHRTGVPLAERGTILALARAAGSRFRGVHYYDGHLHTGTPAERRAAVFACYAPLLELLDALRSAGTPAAEVITSGTPTCLAALAHGPLSSLPDGVHRISPGTVVFHDLRSEEECPDLDLRPAALVLARVVSHPALDLVTCDAGSKSLAAEAGDPCAFVLGRPELVALTPSEEHLPLRVTAGERPPRGTPLLLFPRHVCPTVNLAEEALLVEADGSCRTAPVAARAHDL